MIHSIHSRCLVALGLALAFMGCSSSASQARGMAQFGDSPAMVERRMGMPDEKQDGASLADRQSIWIYKNYLQQNAPPEQSGWTEVLAPAVQDHNGQGGQKAVTRDIYYDQRSEDIQVTFKDGVVMSVEHLQSQARAQR